MRWLKKQKRQANNTSNILLELPKELWVMILAYLPLKDLVSIGRTNKHFHKIAFSDETMIWTMLLKGINPNTICEKNYKTSLNGLMQDYQTMFREKFKKNKMIMINTTIINAIIFDKPLPIEQWFKQQKTRCVSIETQNEIVELLSLFVFYNCHNHVRSLLKFYYHDNNDYKIFNSDPEKILAYFEEQNANTPSFFLNHLGSLLSLKHLDLALILRADDRIINYLIKKSETSGDYKRSLFWMILTKHPQAKIILEEKRCDNASHFGVKYEILNLAFLGSPGIFTTLVYQYQHTKMLKVMKQKKMVDERATESALEKAIAKKNYDFIDWFIASEALEGLAAPFFRPDADTTDARNNIIYRSIMRAIAAQDEYCVSLFLKIKHPPLDRKLKDHDDVFAPTGHTPFSLAIALELEKTAARILILTYPFFTELTSDPSDTKKIGQMLLLADYRNDCWMRTINDKSTKAKNKHKTIKCFTQYYLTTYILQEDLPEVDPAELADIDPALIFTDTKFQQILAALDQDADLLEREFTELIYPQSESSSRCLCM